MNDTTETRWCTAVHEAGHAVAHVRLKLEFCAVSIKPKDGTLGRVIGKGFDHASNRKDGEKQVVAYLAGWAAVFVETGLAKKANEGVGDDFENARKLISRWGLERLSVHKDRALRYFELPKNRRAVWRLASELLNRQSIDGDHAEVIVGLADGLATDSEYKRYLLLRSAE